MNAWRSVFLLLNAPLCVSVWQFMSCSDSLFPTDLSFMEEWPCRGKTLERHDGSSSYYRGPVACSQGLRGPVTKLPTEVFPSEFSISLSAPDLSTCIPYSLRLQSWAAENVCHLFVLRPLWYPLPRVLVTPSLNFTLVRIWFPPDLLSSLCLKLNCLWCLYSLPLCALFMRCVLFFPPYP